MTQPLDLDALRELTSIPRPTPRYRTGSGNFTPEFENEWQRFAKARRDMANAVPELLDLLAATTARAEAAELRADTAIAEAVTIAHHVGHENLADEVRRLRADLAAAVERAEGLRRLLDTAIDYLNSESMWEVVDELRAKVEALAARTEGQAE